jgi:thiamine biosynthesis lipoprotein
VEDVSTTPQLKHLHVEHVMGTVVSIDVRHTGPVDDAVGRVVRWLHDVDATFSTYRPDSAICRFDRGQLDTVPPQVAWVLRRCEELRRETDGFFDARAMGGVLDPSALVKGWAVQRAADLLVAGGLRDFCLNAGGDVVTRGAPHPEPRWRVGIQHPGDRTALCAVVEANDLAVATSGAYERGEHIVDPHTGHPPSGVRSVTVCGPDLGTADAYSTAAFAMGAAGPKWTLGLAGYHALTILADDVVLSTPGFPASKAVSR